MPRNSKCVIYTDGACRNNGRGNSSASYGYHSRRFEGSGVVPSSEPQTNSRGELRGVLEGLHAMRDDIASRNEQPRSVEVRTDSQYVEKTFNQWLPKWESNDWRTSSGKPVCHQDLITEIRDVSRAPEFDGVSFTHVRGHAGDPGNERADLLANQALDRRNAK